MAVETDAERLAFLNPDEFGCEAAYTPKKGGGPRPIAGIFEAPGSDWNPNRWPGGHPIAMQEGAHIVSTSPRFECRVSDLEGGGRMGDGLVIAGTAYRVVKRDPDGTGMTVLTLQDVGEVDP